MCVTSWIDDVMCYFCCFFCSIHSASAVSCIRRTVSNIHRAHITVSNTHGADITVSNIHRADITVSNTHRADITVSNTHRADITVSNTHRADITVSNIHRADITVSNTLELHGVNYSDTRSRNCYQSSGTRHLHVCRPILYKLFFWYKFLARSRTQLYSITETVQHVTRTVQRDWPESCFGARNCDELVSYFSCKFLVPVSWACVAGITLLN